MSALFRAELINDEDFSLDVKGDKNDIIEIISLGIVRMAEKSDDDDKENVLNKILRSLVDACIENYSCFEEYGE